MRIVVLDAKNLGEDLDLSILGAFGRLEIRCDTTADELAEVVKHVQCLVTNRVRIGRGVFDAAGNLELVCLTSTGTDQVDLEAAREHGVAVAFVPAYSTNSVAQHTFALALSLIEQIAYYDRHVRTRDYRDGFTIFHRPFFELAGSTWGIIGMGAIGTRVAEIATAFGCEVLHYSPREGAPPDQADAFDTAPGRSAPRRVALYELLEECDVVSIHAPITEKTRNLISYNELSSMKPTAVLVNVGRGGIVNEHDLSKALNEGLVGGAALDVFAPEPPAPENPLFSVREPSRLLFTPHIAWAGLASRRRLIGEVAKNIDAYRSGSRRNRAD